MTSTALLAQVPIKINYDGHTLYVYPHDLPQNTDQGVAIYNTYTNISEAGAKSKSNGMENTKALIRAYGKSAEAAQVCTKLNEYGYNDWYLPSIDELRAIYKNRTKITDIVGDGYYWSSTETGQWTTKIIHFKTGEELDFNKTAYMSIRPVRRD